MTPTMPAKIIQIAGFYSSNEPIFKIEAYNVYYASYIPPYIDFELPQRIEYLILKVCEAGLDRERDRNAKTF